MLTPAGTAVPAAAPAALPGLPPDIQVLDVRIEGDRTVPLDKIRASIHTRPGRPYDPQQIQQDVPRVAPRAAGSITSSPWSRTSPAGSSSSSRSSSGRCSRRSTIVGNENVKRQDAEEGDRPEGGRRRRPLHRRAGPPQDRGILSEEGLQQGPRDGAGGQQAGRPPRDLRRRRGAEAEDLLGQLRRQHDRQRRAAADPDQVAAPLLLPLQGRSGPQADRRGRGDADRLLQRPGLLRRPRRPRSGVQRGAELADADLRHRRRPALHDPQRLLPGQHEDPRRAAGRED